MLDVTHVFVIFCMLTTCLFDYELIGFIGSQKTPFGIDRQNEVNCSASISTKRVWRAALKTPTGCVADFCTLKGTKPIQTSLSQISPCNTHLQSIFVSYISPHSCCKKAYAFGPPLSYSSSREMQTWYIARATRQKRKGKRNFCLKLTFFSRIIE